MNGSLDHPFATIAELLSFLHSERQPGDIFRGQCTDFPLMTPSAFRSAVVFTNIEQTDIFVSEEQLLATLTRTQKLRWQMMNRLIESSALVWAISLRSNMDLPPSVSTSLKIPPSQRSSLPAAGQSTNIMTNQELA